MFGPPQSNLDYMGLLILEKEEIRPLEQSCFRLKYLGKKLHLNIDSSL